MFLALSFFMSKRNRDEPIHFLTCGFETTIRAVTF